MVVGSVLHGPNVVHEPDIPVGIKIMQKMTRILLSVRVAKLKQAFEQYDVDHSGTIELAEFSNGMMPYMHSFCSSSPLTHDTVACGSIIVLLLCSDLLISFPTPPHFVTFFVSFFFLFYQCAILLVLRQIRRRFRMHSAA